MVKVRRASIKKQPTKRKNLPPTDSMLVVFGGFGTFNVETSSYGDIIDSESNVIDKAVEQAWQTQSELPKAVKFPPHLRASDSGAFEQQDLGWNRNIATSSGISFTTFDKLVTRYKKAGATASYAKILAINTINEAKKRGKSIDDILATSKEGLAVLDLGALNASRPISSRIGKKVQKSKKHPIYDPILEEEIER